MILTLYMLLMATFSFTLYLASSPIILGINILMMALLLSSTFACLLSSWFAFMIFLIYVGGMLVMFAYFLAITPNQQMSMSKTLTIATLSMIILSTTAMSTNMSPPMNTLLTQGNTLLYLSKLAPMLILLALILLLTMVIVVKITHRTSGPLRPFN